jgi:hypothetical protein
VSGRDLVQIGYQVTLGDSPEAARVSVSDRNMSRSLIGYLRAAPGGVTTRPELEKLASWGSRYGYICMYIRPFTRKLYSAYAGKGRAQRFALDAGAMRSIRMIRILLIMTALQPMEFARMLGSFCLRGATVVIVFDACLYGVGIIIYVIDWAGRERPVGACAVDISRLGFGTDSQFQNTAEFIGATLGVLMLKLLKLDGSAVKLRGDSRSALCWGAKMKFKGARTSNAALVFTMLLLQTKVTIADYELLSSEQNGRTDKLSRGYSVDEIRREYSDLEGVPEIVIPKEVLDQALRDCDPAMELESDAAFVELWKRLAVVKGGVER